MKKILFSVFCAVLFIISPAFSAVHNPKVNGVEIYPSGAKVFMDFQVEEDFIIELPGTLDRDSISLIRDKSAAIEKFLVIEEIRTGWIPPSLSEMDAQIRNLKSQQSTKESELAGMTQTKVYLEKLKLESIDNDNFLDFIQELQSKRISIELSISKTELSLENLKREIKLMVDEFNSKMPKDNNRVIVIKGYCAGKGNMRISGWTNQSGWSPLHKMDLDTSEKIVHSLLEGHVSQKSGIDWSGTLRFHTVQPRRSISTPDARPLIVDYRSDARKLDMVLSESMERSGKAVSLPQAINFAETMTDLVITTEGEVSGTGEIAQIRLGRIDIPSNVEIVALPYLSDETWVISKVQNLPFPIIPGRVKLFLDSESSAITSIGEFARGEEFIMAFGRSPMIKAKREKIVPKKGANWIGKGTLEEGYIITVVNGMKTDTEVTVIDRFPLSIQEKIEVVLTEIIPEATERSDENLLTWKIALAPGETKEIRVLYRIKYPSDKEIIFR